MQPSVLVGISGGIDSAATILRLREQGHHVQALYIDMIGCELSRQRVVALSEQLGVQLHIASCEEIFQRRVVDVVLSEHQRGRTPSPCTICNPQIKWEQLKLYADKLGIDKIATGHYIQIATRDERHFVERGIDPAKDQSYYLYTLSQSTLSRAITPLGTMRKTDVREYLASKGFTALAKGSESQGVCFAKSGYGAFLRQNLDYKAGEIIDTEGKVIGTHNGVQLYTVGQKRGYDLHEGQSGEVRSLDAKNNRLTVGAPLLVQSITLSNGWFSPPSETKELRCQIRGLGKNPQCAVRVTKTESGELCVTSLGEPFWAPAAGQPAVIYAGNLVVGGGLQVDTWS